VETGSDFRFFCLGFSAGHDAKLLGDIAKAGSDLGNFVYIADDSADKYGDMKKSLVDIFDLVPGDNNMKGELVGADWSKKVRLIKKEDGRFQISFNIPLTAATG